MKFISILVLFLLFSGWGAEAAQNCLPIDWAYTLNVGGLKIDKDKLADFCSEKTCSINSGFITIRSHFNPDVLLIVKNSEISFRLPYGLSKLGLITSLMNADEYDWQKSVEIDLVFLKHNGILNIENSEIEKISAFSKKGENIFYCQGEWKQLGHNCRCSSDKETCFGCEGAMPLTISIPEELMPYDLAASESTPTLRPSPEPSPQEGTQLLPEKKSVTDKSQKPTYYYFIIIPFLIAVISAIVLKYAKNKKTAAK